MKPTHEEKVISLEAIQKRYGEYYHEPKWIYMFKVPPTRHPCNTEAWIKWIDFSGSWYLNKNHPDYKKED